jgi:crotonobetainyl-CoA:carnitine CoA-transferase CaiB-like acyl-CoA transferase
MALLDTQVSVLANQALGWMASGKVPHRMGNGHSNLVPYQAFACGDGDLVIAVGNDSQFRKLCTVLGLALADDPRFATNPGRVTNREALIPLVAPRSRAGPRPTSTKRLKRRACRRVRSTMSPTCLPTRK